MQGGRNRTQAEEQNQKDGNRAPHLDFMLHEGQMRRNPGVCGGQLSSI
jgi:hypothetical protein